MKALIERLPPGCLALVDEAYHELGVDFDANARVAVQMIDAAGLLDCQVMS